MSRKHTIEDFIKKAQLKHGDTYTYDNSIYINDATKLLITCKKHGEWLQSPRNHLNGYGCPKCSNNIKRTKEDFIDKANLKHNYRYLYDNVDYKNCKIPVSIRCKLHGIFLQTPENHLRGQNCPICCGKLVYDTKSFIIESNKKHGNTYNYNNTNYFRSNIKVIIICKIHGEFKQTPTSHLSGSGCPSCSITKSKAEIKIKKLLELQNIKFEPQYWFNDLKYKRRLRFDFGILDNFNNLKFLLEYNGEQHYKFLKGVHRYENSYEESLIRDQLKKDYCIKNNIPLYIIRYDENITERLQKIINENEKQENRI